MNKMNMNIEIESEVLAEINQLANEKNVTLNHLISKFAIFGFKEYKKCIQKETGTPEQGSKYVNDFTDKSLKFKYAMNKVGDVICFQYKDVKQLKYTLIDGKPYFYCYKKGTKSETYCFSLFEMYDKMFSQVSSVIKQEMEKNVAKRIAESQYEWKKTRKGN